MPRPAFGEGDSTSAISEKGAGMAIKDVLPRLRRERGLTQEGLAKKLFITRQAVSRGDGRDGAGNRHDEAHRRYARCARNRAP